MQHRDLHVENICIKQHSLKHTRQYASNVGSSSYYPLVIDWERGRCRSRETGEILRGYNQQFLAQLTGELSHPIFSALRYMFKAADGDWTQFSPGTNARFIQLIVKGLLEKILQLRLPHPANNEALSIPAPDLPNDFYTADPARFARHLLCDIYASYTIGITSHEWLRCVQARHAAHFDPGTDGLFDAIRKHIFRRPQQVRNVVAWQQQRNYPVSKKDAQGEGKPNTDKNRTSLILESPRPRRVTRSQRVAEKFELRY